MEYRKSEIRAGIFLITAFILFAIMVFVVSDVESLFKGRKEVKALFSTTEGLERNAQVRFSGLKIGQVKNIRVAPEHDDKVEVTMSVYRDAVIKEDAKATIKTLGFIGSKYVDISSGTPGAGPLPPGGMLAGEDALRIEDLAKAGFDVVEKVRRIAQNVDRVLGDPVVEHGIKRTLRNIEVSTANIRTITASVKAMTEENRESINESIKGVPEVMKKLDADLTTLKSVMDKTGILMDQTQTLIGRSDAALADNRKQIDATMENAKEISQNLKELTEDVKKHPWKLIRKP